MGEVPGRLFAIGDIHGCVEELTQLLGALPLTAKDTVVCVGDYIDRGPDSRGVIAALLAWRPTTPAEVVFLKGNHEDMALGFLGRAGHWGEAWFRNGGVAALRSYGIDPDLPASEIASRLPPDHLAFLDALATSHRWRDQYLLVHAGIRPGVPWPEQQIEDLLWIREEFLDEPHDLGATIVFGHTPHRGIVVDLPYKIGIDTGCVYGGALTCVGLPDGAVFQIRRGDRAVEEIVDPHTDCTSRIA
ncbi:MAG: metallophosphoesterase family protein, partial [Candidatus Binatia bacterium]